MNMDRFRFRAWSVGDSQMVYPIDNDAHDMDVLYCKLTDIWRGVEDDNLILMQCTGLKDSEGTLIYEGDVLTGVFHDTCNFATEKNRKQWITVVEWKHAGWELSYGNYEYTRPGRYFHETITAMKVLGNIYENPELLNDKV